jgi:glycosyltransferase A (GT-A) superfamily protein (DUF2064 family)
MDLFTDVPWSSPETLELTRARLRHLGVEWAEIETLPDLDTVDDLIRAIEDPRVPAALRASLASLLRSTTNPTRERL